VLHILEKAFPGMLRYTRRPTRDDVVAIRVLKPDHRLLQHVLTGDSAHVWWLEDQSYPFTVVNRRAVDVLVDSPEMAKKYGSGAVVAAFRAGRGQVVHMISHLYLQRSELRGDADRLPATAVAGGLGFGADSEAVRELKRAGVAEVKAGRVRSAYSAQQFLANLLVDATRDVERPEPEPPIVRPQPPIVRPTPPADGAVTATEATTLRSAPGGDAVKAIAKGLRLTVLGRRDGWVHVATPAGETGWLPADAVDE
jgi:hypothetical protein